MRKNYGVPYKGSKNFIAGKIVNLLPEATTLYEPFAGGCAVSHCALNSGKYQRYVLNDVCDVPQLFKDAVMGKKFSTEWVSRDRFMAEKDQDPFIRMIYSFGNNGRSYIYARTLEPYKKALHYAVVNGEFEDIKKLCPEVYETVVNTLSKIDLADTKTRRIEVGRCIVRWLKEHGTQELIDKNLLYHSCQFKKNHNLKDLKRLQSLERLERLESLESLERLERLDADILVTQGSYDKMQFDDPNGIIYCDPPYKNTDGYSKKKAPFDYGAFYLWCEKQILPVYISGYDMPEDRFLCIAQFKKQSTLCATKSIAVIEKVFRPWAQLR